MSRAQQYRYQPGHRGRRLFSYLDTFFRKYADRDFFFTGRTAAYFFFFALLFTLTANAFEEDRTLATEAGMNGYLTKPIDVEKMMKTIASFL